MPKESTMSAELTQHPISSVNASGFPLQIATTTAIKKSENWRVLVCEHYWRLDRGGDGFIDIIAKQKYSPLEILVIECKRVRQTTWVFLVPRLTPPHRREAIIWGTHLADSVWKQYGWENWPCEPSSYLSEYCAIPGQEQGRMNLLERTASDVVDSVKALASQERVLQARGKAKNFSRVYIPVLVTTAKLLVACFDPSNISLADGTLPKDTDTKEVPYIRFQKRLGTYNGGQLDGTTIEELHSSSQRTVFIVNAENLPCFLNELLEE